MSEALTLSPLEWEGERGPFAKAFVAAQKATDAVKKASTNPAFKSKYADLAGVVEAVVPALNAHGIGVLQFPAFDGEFVSVTTELLHESGASVRSTLKMRPTKNDPQGEGSAITYARRYSLLAMTGAAPEDDDGNSASQGREPVKINGQQITELEALIERAGVKADVVLASCGAKRLADITAGDLPGLRRKLQDRINAHPQQEAA